MGKFKDQKQPEACIVVLFTSTITFISLAW